MKIVYTITWKINKNFVFKALLSANANTLCKLEIHCASFCKSERTTFYIKDLASLLEECQLARLQELVLRRKVGYLGDQPTKGLGASACL